MNDTTRNAADTAVPAPGATGSGKTTPAADAGFDSPGTIARVRDIVDQAIQRSVKGLEFITSPDPARGRREMNITGVVRTARVFGPNVELRRTISST